MSLCYIPRQKGAPRVWRPASRAKRRQEAAALLTGEAGPPELTRGGRWPQASPVLRRASCLAASSGCSSPGAPRPWRNQAEPLFSPYWIFTCHKTEPNQSLPNKITSPNMLTRPKIKKCTSGHMCNSENIKILYDSLFFNKAPGA